MENNEEILNPDFDINAKYEDMMERAKHNIDLYLETGKDYVDISLSYDVKNYLPLALKEIQRLNNIISELDAMFDGDLDGFFTINEKGSCNDIIEVIQNYKNELKELKEGK